MAFWSRSPSPMSSYDSAELSSAPSSAAPHTPPPSAGVKLPGIRDLFPDHIHNRSLRSEKQHNNAHNQSYSKPETIYIPSDEDMYEDAEYTELESSPDSDGPYPPPPHSATDPRNIVWDRRNRAFSVSDADWEMRSRSTTYHNSITPIPDSSLQQRRRAHTLVEVSFPGKYRPNGVRILGRTATHVCNLCGKRFDRPSSLRTHYNSHTGVTPFRCPWPHCGREFNVKSNMRRHYRKHGGAALESPPP